MPRIIEVIKRLFPLGTNPPGPSQGAPVLVFDRFPYWPPDAFAVAATLVNMSGCYSRPPFSGGDSSPFFDARFNRDVRELGRAWAELPDSPGQLSGIQAIWDRLVQDGGGEVGDASDQCASDWWRAAMQLLIIADEACVGVGFVTPAEDSEAKMTDLAALVFDEYLRYAKRNVPMPRRIPEAPTPFGLPFIPYSLCRMVSPDEVCVQPKTRTPQIGCTIRSLTHNVALLTPLGDVQTTWLYGMDEFNAGKLATRPLNLLLVPFPYALPCGCFQVGQRAIPADLAELPDGRANRHHYFCVQQKWLDGTDGANLTERLGAFLLRLIDQAYQSLLKKFGEDTDDRTHIHGLILPELALSEHVAQELAGYLARETNLEFFITGASSHPQGSAIPKNRVCTFIFHKDKVFTSWAQSKHHRWQLEASQIESYGLNTVFDKENYYWERINIENRHCAFWVFRPGASMAAMICEDLARIDPVQTVIRAVGPNLVIALLMDGPQREWRWPNRYATVLADDPGSSVLTFTSLALSRMMKRSADDNPDYPIALWKQMGKRSQMLALDEASHALLLSLASKSVTNFTLDGRSDGGATIALEIEDVLQVADSSVPRWIDGDPLGG
jgi:hypothetical protein